jgi:hypothetical protein
MFSRSTFLLQQLTTGNSRRNLSIKQLNDIKPIITRNLAWFSRQPGKQTFGLWEFLYKKTNDNGKSKM